MSKNSQQLTTSSDDLPEKEESEDGDSEDINLTERVQQFLDSIQNRLNAEESLEDNRKDVDLSYDFDDPALPTDYDVYKEAMDLLVKQEQDRLAEEDGIEDEEIIRRRKVDLNLVSNSSPRQTVIDFGLALEHIYPQLVQIVEERNQEEDVNPIMDSSPPTMTKLVAKNVGQYNNVTIFFGARNLIYNISAQLNLTNDERELVQKCHNVAAKRNNLHKYTLRDDVVIVDQLLSEKTSD